MIDTSHFNNKDAWSHPGAIRISRRNCQKKGSHHPKYADLAPSKELLDDWNTGKITEAEYTRIFNQQLAALSPEKVYNDLMAITSGHDAVLLCHCATGKFCHRRLVAAWLENALQIKVPEL